MNNLLKFSKKRYSNNTHKNTLLEEISLTKLALECAYSKFDNTCDPDLIDSSIYELNAAQKKYKFLLNELKAIS